MKRWAYLVCGMVLAGMAAAPARAEEFLLKDGTRLVGTIIGYEGKAFRVRTSFGLAIIEKDKVERIIFDSVPTLRVSEARSLLRDPNSTTPLFYDPINPPPPPFDATFFARTEKGSRSAFRTRPLPQAHPPRPARVIEVVKSTSYLNQSFRFSMYKPPTWHSYPSLVRPETQMIAALGTQDESTLLLVGWEYYQGKNSTYARLAEASLRAVYTDYRKLSEGPVQIAGQRAFQRRFDGFAEGRYWTGWVIYLTRGAEHYTFLGLTSAGEFTDFQEIVLRKVLNSIRFHAETPPAAQTTALR